MTACSNHPGTPAGLALAQLLGDAESLVAALRDVEAGWCAERRIERSDWLLLRGALANRGQVAGPSARAAALATAGWLSVQGEDYALSARARTLLAELDRLRFEWVDAIAASLDSAQLRAMASRLRQLAAQLTP